jgi:molybdopterin-guanine dinucleotide biosynthesis protein A
MKLSLKQGAIVLCGGQSSRMGYPKALLPFGSEAMLTRVLSRLDTKARTCIVVASPGQALPELPPEVRVTRDERPGQGPLEGLLAGLKAGRGLADAFYTSSCDVPLLRPQWVQGLFDRLTAEDDIVVPCDDRHHHPLAAVYRPRIVPAIESLLSNDQRRPFLLFAEVPTREVPVDELRAHDPELDSLLNVNSPSDYARAIHRAGLSIPAEVAERFGW